MSLSINEGTKLPPVYKGNPEILKGTIFAVGEAQATQYVENYAGRPIPDTWKDGNPKMQVVFYVVGESGKVVRIFTNKVSKEKEPGSSWKAWKDTVLSLEADSFEALLNHTLLFNVKTTYKPGGKVAFREWAITEVAGENYIDNMLDEWKDLPRGVLPTFYYPGYSPEEMAARKPVAAPPAQAVAPTTANAPAATAPVTQAPVASDDVTVYDQEIPF